MAHIILDIIVILILVLTIVLGYRRGFLRSLIQLIGCIAAFVLAFTLSTPIAEFTFDGFLAEGVKTQLTEALSGITEVPPADQLHTLLQELPSPIVSVLENNTQLQETLQELSGTIETSTASLVETLMAQVIRPITVSLIQFIVFILLFVVLLFVAKLLAKLIKPVAKLPLIRQADGALGAALGLIKGAVLVLALVTVIQLIAATGSQDGFITQDMVDNSTLVSWIAEINPITNALG